jgi:hypothetical protein
LENTKQLIKLSSIIFLLSELWMSCAPLTWQEQVGLGHKPHPAAFPGALAFASVSIGSWIVTPVHCSYRLIYGFTDLITQQYTNLLSNSKCVNSYLFPTLATAQHYTDPLSNSRCRHTGNVFSPRNCCTRMSQTSCCYRSAQLKLYIDCEFEVSIKSTYKIKVIRI